MRFFAAAKKPSLAEPYPDQTTAARHLWASVDRVIQVLTTYCEYTNHHTKRQSCPP